MKYMCLALASLFFAGMPTLAMGTLSEIVCGIEAPQPGRYYECGVYPLRVFQIVSANGVVAHVDPRDFSSSAIRTMVYLRTNTSNMYEGMCIKGMYQCTGYIDYKTVLGASKRLPAFRELTREEIEKIKAEIRAAIQRKKEEELRHEIVAQPKRRDAAQRMFSSLNFDAMRNIYIDRRLSPLAGNIRVEVEHFALATLQQKCSQKDWLGVLNIVYDILQGSSDFTNHYEKFPKEEEIKSLFSNIQKFSFSARWILPENVALIVSGAEARDIVAELKGYERLKGFVTQSGFIALFSQKKYLLGIANGRPYIPHESESTFKELLDASRSGETVSIASLSHSGISTDGSFLKNVDDSKYVIPGVATLEAKKLLFAAQLASRKITQTEYDKKVSELDKAIDDAIARTFVNLTDIAAIKKAAKDVQDEEASNFSGQKEIVFDRLSKMSFNVSDYVVVQESLLPYIHSAIIKEHVWEELRKKHREGDYMGMLNCIASGARQFNENDIECIHECEKKLTKKAFHLEIKLTHNIRMKACGWQKSGFSVTSEELHKFASSKDGAMTVDFELGNAGQMFVLEDVTPDPLYELYRNVSQEIHSVRKEVSYGNIGKDEAKSKEASLIAEYKGKIASWMKTAKLRTDQRRLEKIPRPSTGTISVFGISQSSKNKPEGRLKPKWIACPDCEGSRYISKGQCDKCGGEGKYRTPVTHGIGGRSMGGRVTQCDKCKGKGEIKESCKRCRGRGKVKQ